MNRGRHTQCGHLALFLWLEKQQVESVVKNLFLSVFTVITFHSKVLCIHMEAGTWVYVCVTVKHTSFSHIQILIILYFCTDVCSTKIPIYHCIHTNTHTLALTHTYTGSKMASHDTQNMEKH